MTLRCTLEIVPHGQEEDKLKIGVFNIHNVRTIEDLGFGNVYCEYRVDIKGTDKHEDDTDVFRVHHNRRNGAEELVRKVLEKYVDEDFD